ncbi:GGDEF domain-containing protein [Desulfoscipio gibsoniae]
MFTNRIKMLLKNKRNLWFAEISEIDKPTIDNTLLFINICRLRVIAWLIITFMLVLVFTQLFYINKIDLSLSYISKLNLTRILDIGPNIITLRLIIIGLAIIFLKISNRLTSPDAILQKHYYYELSYLIINLIGFAVLSGLIQSVGPGIASSYIMAVLIAASFLYLNWLEAIIVFGLAWIVMSIMVWTYQPDWIIASSAFVNGSINTILAFIISQIMYINSVKNLLNYRLIERQKKELAISNNKLKQLSFFDPLTNIPNRRYFNDFLNREWKRAYREKESLCLLMVDIDQFKLYNDTFGHQAGDDILVKVAQELNGVIKRPGDLIARYGGEEFIIVLPKTNLSDGCLIAKRMIKAVELLDIKHPSVPAGRLSISIGIAWATPSNSKELPKNLIELADKALYSAKSHGGNCYILGNETNPM